MKFGWRKALIAVIGIPLVLLVLYLIEAWFVSSMEVRFDIQGRVSNITVPNFVLKVMCEDKEFDIENPPSIDEPEKLFPRIIEGCDDNTHALLLFGTTGKAYDLMLLSNPKFNPGGDLYYAAMLLEARDADEPTDGVTALYKGSSFEEAYRVEDKGIVSFIETADSLGSFYDDDDDGRGEMRLLAPVAFGYGFRTFVMNDDGSVSVWVSFLWNRTYSYALRDGVPHYDGKPLQGADAATFRILDGRFAKDANRLYYNGMPTSQYDAATFEVLEPGEWAKDKNGVYYDFPYSDGYTDIPYDVLEGADPVTFVSIGNGYAKDKNRVYASNQPIEGADPATFELIPDKDNSFSWSKDKNRVYRSWRVVEGADPETFIAFDHQFGRDDRHLVFMNSIVPNGDPDTFEYVSDQWPVYARDKSQVYVGSYNMENPTIRGADPATFEIIGGHGIEYSRDSDQVFVGVVPIEGADPASFVVLCDGYSKDKNHVYLNDNVVPGLDAKTYMPERGQCEL